MKEIDQNRRPNSCASDDLSCELGIKVTNHFLIGERVSSSIHPDRGITTKPSLEQA